MSPMQAWALMHCAPAHHKYPSRRITNRANAQFLGICCTAGEIDAQHPKCGHRSWNTQLTESLNRMPRQQ